MSVLSLANTLAGLGTLAMSAVLAWLLFRTRGVRLSFLTKLAPDIRGEVANLFATAWLFPVLFLVGGTSRLALAHGTGTFPVAATVLIATVTLLCAFHIARSARRISRLLGGRACPTS